MTVTTYCQIDGEDFFNFCCLFRICELKRSISKYLLCLFTHIWYFFHLCRLFFQAIPEAVVSWKYKETEINNGSTLVNDIDMRQYYYGSRHVAKCIKNLTLFTPRHGYFLSSYLLLCFHVTKYVILKNVQDFFKFEGLLTISELYQIIWKKLCFCAIFINLKCRKEICA